MRFEPSLLDQIRARLPISQVVGRRVTYDKRKSQPARGDFWACCPFHKEKTSSFHCDDRRGIYTELTAEGRAAYDAAKPTHDRVLEAALDDAEQVPELAGLAHFLHRS